MSVLLLYILDSILEGSVVGRKDSKEWRSTAENDLLPSRPMCKKWASNFIELSIHEDIGIGFGAFDLTRVPLRWMGARVVPSRIDWFTRVRRNLIIFRREDVHLDDEGLAFDLLSGLRWQPIPNSAFGKRKKGSLQSSANFKWDTFGLSPIECNHVSTQRKHKTFSKKSDYCCRKRWTNYWNKSRSIRVFKIRLWTRVRAPNWKMNE